MKPTLALYVAVFAHALLIGLLIGLSMSPIVGVVLPLLLGVGGYRLIDSFTGAPTPETKGVLSRVPAGVGWVVALWCVVVAASLFTGIGLRTGAINLGRRQVSTLSLVRLEGQSISRITDLTLICGYYDRLELSLEQRRTVAQALSDTTTDTASIVTTLQNHFSKDQSAAKVDPSPYGVYGFSQGTTPR